MANTTKVFTAANIDEFTVFTKFLEKHILEGGSIIFPETKARYDVTEKFASSKKVVANSYLTEVSKDLEDKIADPLAQPCVMVVSVD